MEAVLLQLVVLAAQAVAAVVRAREVVRALEAKATMEAVAIISLEDLEVEEEVQEQLVIMAFSLMRVTEVMVLPVPYQVHLLLMQEEAVETETPLLALGVLAAAEQEVLAVLLWGQPTQAAVAAAVQVRRQAAQASSSSPQPSA